MDTFAAFLKENPHIQYAAPESSDYAELKATFIAHDSVQPSYIVRPKNANEVSALVAFLQSKNINFTVRSGGHDIHGRSHANDSVTLDMRDIAYVEVDKSSSTAKVGGGILTGEVATQLSKHGLATASTNTPQVGWAGWALYGGYGPFLPNFGLGADQIVGAKVVNADGAIVDADANMLKGIRGAGGAFGVLVELTIKVYPLKEVLAGLIMYTSDNIHGIMHEYNTEYSKLSNAGLPAALQLQQIIINHKDGKRFGVLFSWSSNDMEEGKAWLDKTLALIPNDISATLNFVKEMPIPEWLKISGAGFPDSAYGSIYTCSFHKMTDEVIDVFASHVTKMTTDPVVMISLHEFRGRSTTTEYSSQSVFGSRAPHFMLEIIMIVDSIDKIEPSKEWGSALYKAILETDSSNILPGTYISITGPDESNYVKIYGENYQTLVDLKQQYDPRHVFKSALPKF